jgi:hypothetical protein
VPPETADSIEGSRGHGVPLPGATRTRMESGFGVSFADVRVHTDGGAQRVSRQLGARALTVGSDIYFASGEFRPRSSGGERLLTHELAHTVQRSPASPVVRRTMDHAAEYARWNSLPDITAPDKVKAYVEDDKNPVAHRKALLAEYNRDLKGAARLDLEVEDPSSSSTSTALVATNPHATVDATSFELLQELLNFPDLAKRLFGKLSSKELFQFASAGTITRDIAQRWAITYLPKYEDRFQFSLATKGLLMVTPPDVKYGGAASAGKPHATSGFKWYTAALTGTGPIVLGALDDYMPMRDYTTYMRDENDAASVEATAKYLMAWPWSLLVNAALVTGAIHGRRTIVGATDPRGPTALYKDPHGLSVYARELIQTVLIHGYSAGGTASDYPSPATGGGLVLKPPAKTTSPATVFDVDDELKKHPEYGTEKDAATLKQDLKAQADQYAKLTFDDPTIKSTETKKKDTTGRYDKLKNALRKYHDKGVPKPGIDARLETMIKVIYINAPRSLPSLSTWEVDKFVAQFKAVDPTVTLT